MKNYRIEQLFFETIGCNKPYQKQENLLSLVFGGKKYTEQEMRDNWESGLKLGIAIGLDNASLEGQKIELYKNTTNDKHKEFIEKFYQLCGDYKCAVQYHPLNGMVIVARENV